MNKNMQKTALTTSAVLAGMVLGVNVNQSNVHADTTNTANAATNNSDQQLANLKSQQAANESAVASSNAAAMSTATTSANSQVADLNNQIQQRQASNAAAQQTKIDQVNKDAQVASNAENSAYSDAVTQQKVANDAELKTAQAKAASERKEATDQENTTFQKQTDDLEKSHKQNLNNINTDYQNQTEQTNQKITAAKNADQERYNQAVTNATKQVDDQINAASNKVDQAQKQVNTDNDDLKKKQAADDQTQEKLKAAKETLNNDQDALSAAQKQAEDAILPHFPQYVDISQDYIDNLPKVHDQQSADALEALDPEHSNFFRNSYQSDPYAANEQIDVTNLTPEQLLQINLYSTRLINQIRSQFNQPGLTLNSQGIQNAQWIANEAGKRKSTKHEADLLNNNFGENTMGLVFSINQDSKDKQISHRNATDYTISKMDNGYFGIGSGNSSLKTMDDLQAAVYYSILMMLFGDGGNNMDGHALNFIMWNGQMALGVEHFYNDTSNKNHIQLRWIFGYQDAFDSSYNIDTTTQPSFNRKTETKTVNRQIILQTPTGNQYKSQPVTLSRTTLTDPNTGQTISSVWHGTFPTVIAPQKPNLTIANPDAGRSTEISTNNPYEAIDPVTFIYEKNYQTPDRETYQKTSQNDYYTYNVNIQYLLPDNTSDKSSKITVKAFRFKNPNGTYSDYDNQNISVEISGIPVSAVSNPIQVTSNDSRFLEYKIKVTLDQNQIKKAFPGYKLKFSPEFDLVYYVQDTDVPFNGFVIQNKTYKCSLISSSTTDSIPASEKQYININYQTANGKIIAVDHLVGRTGDSTKVNLNVPARYDLVNSAQPTSFAYQFKTNQPDITVLVKDKNGNQNDTNALPKPENPAKKLQDQIKQLAAKVGDDGQAVADAQNNANTTASELKGAQDKLASDAELLSQAQTKLNDLKNNRTKAIKDMAGEPTESPVIKELQNQLVDIKNNRDKAIKNENNQYDAKVSDLNSKHDAKLKAIANQPTNLEALASQQQAKLDNLKSQHEAKLKQINDDANAKVDAIKSQKISDPEIDKLQGQIDQIKSDLAKKQQELDTEFKNLQVRDKAAYDALVQKLKNSSAEAAKGNHDHYTTDNGSTTVKLPDNKGKKDDASEVKPDNGKTDADSTKTHKDVTNPTTDKKPRATELPENKGKLDTSATKDHGNNDGDLDKPIPNNDHNTKEDKPKTDNKDVTGSTEKPSENSVKTVNDDADKTKSGASTISGLSNPAESSPVTSTAFTPSIGREKVNPSSASASTYASKTREEVKAQRLPQTGNKSSLAMILVGTVAAMFGLGLAGKKRMY